jgi:hypothetical protein
MDSHFDRRVDHEMVIMGVTCLEETKFNSIHRVAADAGIHLRPLYLLHCLLAFEALPERRCTASVSR